MIEEIHLFGVYVPTALAWAVIAAVITFAVRGYLHRLPLERWIWNPSLVELAFFTSLWWGLSALADRFLAHGMNF